MIEKRTPEEQFRRLRDLFGTWYQMLSAFLQQDLRKKSARERDRPGALNLEEVAAIRRALPVLRPATEQWYHGFDEWDRDPAVPYCGRVAELQDQAFVFPALLASLEGLVLPEALDAMWDEDAEEPSSVTPPDVLSIVAYAASDAYANALDVEMEVYPA